MTAPEAVTDSTWIRQVYTFRHLRSEAAARGWAWTLWTYFVLAPFVFLTVMAGVALVWIGSLLIRKVEDL